MKRLKPTNYEVFITSTVNADVSRSPEMAKAVFDAAWRFSQGDWGDMCREDKKYNDCDLRDRDGHVCGRYKTPNGDIYINLVFDEPSIGGDVAVIMYCYEY